MRFEEFGIMQALNYILADSYKASGAGDVEQWDSEAVREWVGKGKTLSDLLGSQEAEALYNSPDWNNAIRWVTEDIGLDMLEDYLNDNGKPSALRLRILRGRLIIFAGWPEGQAWITTPTFKREYLALNT